MSREAFWTVVVDCMDSDILGQVYAEMPTCSEYELVRRYMELDREFAGFLKSEFCWVTLVKFGIEI